MDLRDFMRLKIIWLSLCFANIFMRCWLSVLLMLMLSCWGWSVEWNSDEDEAARDEKIQIVSISSSCNSASSWFEYEKLSVSSERWGMKLFFFLLDARTEKQLWFWSEVSHSSSRVDELWEAKKMSHRRRKFIFNDSQPPPTSRVRSGTRVRCEMYNMGMMRRMNNQAGGEREVGKESEEI